MSSSRLVLLPILGSITAMLAFSASYIIAVIKKDVYPWWPYISDTGTTVPESCIFGELLTITAVIGLLTIFVRFKFIQSIPVSDLKLSKLNTAGLIVGVISCFAMTFVANFQETSIRSVHMPSASVTFGFGIIYNLLHTIITRRISPRYCHASLWIVRLMITAIGFVAFGMLYGFGISAVTRGKYWFGNDTKKRLHWNPHDPGWGLHLVSSISEWIIGLSFALYFLTYCKEFAKIKLDIKVQNLLQSEENSDLVAQSDGSW